MDIKVPVCGTTSQKSTRNDGHDSSVSERVGDANDKLKKQANEDQKYIDTDLSETEHKLGTGEVNR